MNRRGSSVIQGFFAHGTSHLAARFGVAATAQPKGATPISPQRRVPQPLQRPNPIQRHTAMNGSAFQVPEHLGGFAQVGGQPLPPAVRQKMESFFGSSFADVRVHVGPHAQAIGALAFTQGTHIHFAPGQYNPSSLQGQQLLGHELTHVVQQRAGRVRNPFGSGVAVVQDVGLEAEAELLGRRAAATVAPVQPRLAVTTRPAPVRSAVQPVTSTQLAHLKSIQRTAGAHPRDARAAALQQSSLLQGRRQSAAAPSRENSGAPQIYKQNHPPRTPASAKSVLSAPPVGWPVQRRAGALFTPTQRILPSHLEPSRPGSPILVPAPRADANPFGPMWRGAPSAFVAQRAATHSHFAPSRFLYGSASGRVAGIIQPMVGPPPPNCPICLGPIAPGQLVTCSSAHHHPYHIDCWEDWISHGHNNNCLMHDGTVTLPLLRRLRAGIVTGARWAWNQGAAFVHNNPELGVMAGAAGAQALNLIAPEAAMGVAGGAYLYHQYRHGNLNFLFG